MNKFPNKIQDSLENNAEFNKKIQNSILENFNKSDIFFCNDKFESKVFLNKKDNKYYLFLKNVKENHFSVYEEHVSSYNEKEPFKYAIESLKKHGEIYSNKIYSFDLNNTDSKKNEHSIEKHLTILSKIKLLIKKENYFVSNSCYNLKMFSKFLNIENNDIFWTNLSKPLNLLIDKNLNEYSIAIKYFFDTVKDGSFTEKNKFTFNDLDNHLWSIKDGIVFDNQTLGFLCLKKDNDFSNFTIYCYDTENNGKKNKSIDELLNDLKENGENLINNVALKVENGKTIFVDNSLIYCLDLDIVYTKNALISEGYGKPDYPVDIYSYEYQLSYYQKKYKVSEMEFLQQALLTLGGGFEYDSEKGRFFDNSVIYSKDVVGFKLKEDNSLESIYGYPMNFDKLDDSWKKAITNLLEVLKKDRPLPIIVDSELEKNKKLEEIIQFFDKKLNGSSVKKNKM